MRIVCFHLNQVGDLIFSLPALKCIRDAFPGSEITSVARPSGKELLESTGLVDEVLLRPRELNLNKYRLARKLCAGRYDLAVVFSQSADCALLAYMTRAPRRVGFVDTTFGALLTERVEFHHPPSVQNNLRLVSALGCEITKGDYAGLLRPTASQIERAERVLEAHGIGPGDRLAALAPGTSGRRGVKEWADEGFAAVGKHLSERGLKVIVLGTVAAYNIVKEYASIIDLSGKTDLGEAAAILDRCDTLVAVDSGILHLCAAVGTPVVGLYGPSNPMTTGPQGEGHVVITSGAECSPCARTTCDRDRVCMTGIRPEAVMEAVDKCRFPP